MGRGSDQVMASRASCLRDVGASLLILGLSLAGETVAKADEPVSPPNSPGRFLPPLPQLGPRRPPTPEQLEIIKERQRKREAEYAARPKPPPPPTGIFPEDGDIVGEHFGSSYRMENAWHEIVNGEDVYVYAGAMRFDPRSQVSYDPLTSPGLVVIEIGGLPGNPNYRNKWFYTPTAVGSLRIIAAKGNVLTLQSRQGHKFSLNVQTAEELTPLGSR